MLVRDVHARRGDDPWVSPMLTIFSDKLAGAAQAQDYCKNFAMASRERLVSVV